MGLTVESAQGFESGLGHSILPIHEEHKQRLFLSVEMSLSNIVM